MKKKFVKYGKILLALTLIGALALPSYATVGASDGSAFVTKAEFDAALSDFNARLTTFEAGINSKIDSQVSSYLDRNGIWNGKEQNYYKNKFTLFGQYKNVFDASTENLNSACRSFNCQVDVTGVVITECNKTGLMYIEYQDSSATTTVNTQRLQMAFYKDKSNWYTDDNFDFIESFARLKPTMGSPAVEVEWANDQINMTSPAAPAAEATVVPVATGASFKYRKKGSTGGYTTQYVKDCIAEVKTVTKNYQPVAAGTLAYGKPGTRLVSMSFNLLKHMCHTFFVSKGDFIAYYATVEAHYKNGTSLDASKNWTSGECQTDRHKLNAETTLYKTFVNCKIY